MIFTNVMSLLACFLIFSSFMYSEEKTNFFTRKIFEICILEFLKSLILLVNAVVSFQSMKGYCENMPVSINGVLLLFYENSILF
jgi:hypothetical protein